LPVDGFASRLSWIFQTNNNFFEEVAKLRAARRLWARIMKERFGATDPRSWMFRTHVQTSGSSLVAQQPMNNIIRATLQTLSAVLGGVQSLAVSSYDEAICLPGEESVQLSLRTQQIIGDESGVADTVDPLGGSYFIESLTDKLEQSAREYIEKIDSLGGAVSAIEQGYPQREIQESSYRFHQEVESGSRVVVGVNKYISPYPPITEITRVDAHIIKKQHDNLTRLKQQRDAAKVATTLENLKIAALGQENSMPYFMECVEAYATIGEICNVLRGVFGLQKEYLVF
jgi:methylmalonyl-CoA mutase N-terminal domain/subunit